jgi:hypothetical protein
VVFMGLLFMITMFSVLMLAAKHDMDYNNVVMKITFNEDVYYPPQIKRNKSARKFKRKA